MILKSPNTSIKSDKLVNIVDKLTFLPKERNSSEKASGFNNREKDA